MNNQETLRRIAELVDLQEDAIQQHPAELVAVYIEGRDAFLEGQSTFNENDWPLVMSLTLEDISLMRRYMLSSSFISAWYHLAGDKANRDKAAHSCCILVEDITPNPEMIMKKYIEYEQLWRQNMKYEGVAPYSLGFVGYLIMIIILVIIIYWIFIK